MERFKLIVLDWISLVLTVVAAGFHFAGFFIKEWWINTNDVGTSHVGMMSLTVCEITCVNKSVLDIEEGNGRFTKHKSCNINPIEPCQREKLIYVYIRTRVHISLSINTV